MRPTRLLSYSAIALLLASCSRYQDVVLHEITDAELISMNAKSIALRVDARIENPNGFRIHVEEPDVDLFLNDRYIGKALLDSALVIDKKTTSVYPVYMHADLAGGPLVAMLITSALSGEVKVGAKGSAAGRAGALKKRFPFDVSQVISLRD
ncbi:MAG: LEA type 2 family protein [Flavobacteriales bacterium]|nr:LEA type 2 family protein [Flavobacteriales bacterium]